MNYEQNAAQAFGAVIQNKENTPPDDSFDPADEFNEDSDMPIFSKDERTGKLTPEVPETPVENPPNKEIAQNAQNKPLREEIPVNEQPFKVENKIDEIVNNEPDVLEEPEKIEASKPETDDSQSDGDLPQGNVDSNFSETSSGMDDSDLFSIFSTYPSKNAEREDREPANKQNTKAETVNRSGLTIENNPSSHYCGHPAPLGTANEFGITEFVQTLDAMCGRFTDKSGEEDVCMESCPFYSENVEGNCVIQQFPRTDALLSWCAAVLQKYMTEETQQKSRRIDVMTRMIPGFKEEYLSAEGKCTALDHVERKESEKAWTWLDLLKTALPDFKESELSEEGLKALKQTTQW